MSSVTEESVSPVRAKVANQMPKGLIPIPDAMRLGIEQELEDLKILLESFTTETLIGFYLNLPQLDMQSAPPLTFNDEETANVFTRLKESPCTLLDELGNPATGSGWSATLTTETQTVVLIYGGYGLNVVLPEEQEQIVFALDEMWEVETSAMIEQLSYR